MHLLPGHLLPLELCVISMRVRSESTARQNRSSDESADSSSTAPITETPIFRLGRALFGGILAFNALENLRNLEERIAYAEAKNSPKPGLSVPTISAGLLVGGLGVALWRVPAAAAAAVAGFLLGVTPVMHDFWNVDDPEQRQQELIHFLKNMALFGAALAFLKIGQQSA
ncbi:Uncharacterized membrane protein YphA, DoxX/SURF4 family [Natronorubrum sediminis]|uniref:Uncharacterized membrane protein YphA, DoxX/SURF4 family n=2 Tax=Natronorubrum sediminis TaxID=640943 RepID=A0A1H6FZN5_9EURY|nr:Uncharacterized membrane protein YphA, DoxX/SURF4 family [Natronorubrum sediminis]